MIGARIEYYRVLFLSLAAHENRELALEKTEALLAMFFEKQAHQASGIFFLIAEREKLPENTRSCFFYFQE